MERFCITFEIASGMEAEYKRRHDEIWPELVQAIRSSGLSNFSLFRHETRIIGYVECEPDAATAFAKLGPLEVNQRWTRWFLEDGVVVKLTDEDGNLIHAEEVWHLD